MLNLSTNMKFQNISMTGCKDMDKNVRNRTLSLWYPYGALTSCKKLEKQMDSPSNIQRWTTDQQTDRQG